MKKKSVLILSVTQLITSLIISLLLILFSITGSFKGFYLVFSGLSGNLQADSYNFFSNLANNINFLGSITTYKEENEKLKLENQRLLSENSELKIKINDYNAIVRQLNFDLPYQLEPVRVIRYDENAPGEIEINKGSEDKLKIGMVLAVDNFAVGEITEVQAKFSRVRLLTSPKSTVAVVSLKNGTRGILKGELGVGLSLSEVLTEHKLDPGEELVTTGVNSNYPYGLRVGEVGEVSTIQSELTKTAKITNNIPFASLHNLFVIIR